MIRIDIPGRGRLDLEYLVMDFNGTLAVDGLLIAGIREKLTLVSERIKMHVLTADTFGTARAELEGLNLSGSLVEHDNQDTGKAEYIARLNETKVVSIGNGRNDSLMLKNAALGIAVLEGEGASFKAIQQADIICKSVHDALDLLLNPQRIVATLRN